MASGVNHIKGTVLIALPVGVASLLGTGSITAGFFSALGCLSGVIFSPDLDVDHRTRSEYLVYRHIGRIPGAIWFAFWWPYARLIPHRHPLSHWPILGTIGRVLYIYVLGGTLWFGGSYLLAGSGSWLPLGGWLQNVNFNWALVGLAASDTLHYFMDVLPFWRERRRRFRWRRRRR